MMLASPPGTHRRSRRFAAAAARVTALVAALLAGSATAWAQGQGMAPGAATPEVSAASPQPPPPLSLMFSADEINKVKAAIAYRERLIAEGGGGVAVEGEAGAAETVVARHPNIYVSAVLDLGGGRWTVWANGMRITPDSQSPLFSVVGVKDNAVDIFVPGDDGGRFRLHPYETWRARQRDVVPGIAP